MEIRRFGPGHRRPEGPPGTTGMTGQVIHSDERGVVAELAFSRRGVIAPHSNPNLTLFVVISGGGFVQVGEERTRINHGEVVVWPANVPHGAYTDGSEMRAIVIELPEVAALPAVIEGGATPLSAEPVVAGAEPAAAPSRPGPTRAQGALAERQLTREEYDASEGEPW
jgi:quercetin dioxygenase-like cupin family protein